MSGYVVRDPALRPSNWRSTKPLEDELRDQGVVGICGIDTRALTRHLRERGAMRVGIFSGEEYADASPTVLADRVRTAPSMAGAALAGEVSTTEPYVVEAVGEKRFTRRGDRPRDQGDDAAADGRARHRGARAPAVDDVRRGRRPGAGRGVLLQRPGRPGDGGGRGRAAAPGPRRRDPLLRHLLRQPAARPGPRVRHLQAEVRPPGHQPAGHGPHHRQGRGDGAQPRLRGGRADRPRQRHPVRPRPGLARLPQRRGGRGDRVPRRPCVLRAVPPGGRGRAARRRIPLRPVRDLDGPTTKRGARA